MSELLSALQAIDRLSLVDLTHPLEEDMPVYPAHSRYFHTLWDSPRTGSLSLAYQLVINEHCGTHMDATAHFLDAKHPNHRFMAETDPLQCFGRALTLDFAFDELVSAEHIQSWEARHRPIQEGDIVLFRFGWDRYWAPRSVSRAYTDAWPGIGADAAAYLAAAPRSRPVARTPK